MLIYKERVLELTGIMKLKRRFQSSEFCWLMFTLWIGFIWMVMNFTGFFKQFNIDEVRKMEYGVLEVHQQDDQKPKIKNKLTNEQSRRNKDQEDWLKEPVKFYSAYYIQDDKYGPQTSYEQTRRRVKANINEMWNFISAELQKIYKEALPGSPHTAKQISRVLNGGLQHKRSLMRDMTLMPKFDGYTSWRNEEAADLSDLVQRRIQYLQAPKDCAKAKKLVCNINKACGFGCQLHHVAYCLIVGYGMERTLILNSKGWLYNNDGWETFFQPVSNCTIRGRRKTSYESGNLEAQILLLGNIDSIHVRPPYLPLAVPVDLTPRLLRLHGNPSAWWVGQFLRYLLRPQPQTSTFIKNYGLKINFKGPIVGVHIRRTDKIGVEALFHSIEEYMTHVEEYFKLLSQVQKYDKKRIYLATDEPEVFNIIYEKYSDYEILGNRFLAKTAGVMKRHSPLSLQGIILDIYYLSRSDFLVCTFSSQVCRVAYEIMQTLHTDAADRFISLDDVYYFGGQTKHWKTALLPHKADSPDEINLEVGDKVGIAGNHWNGFCKGQNQRTYEDGLYPAFKVDEVIDAVDFPIYPQVPLIAPKSKKNRKFSNSSIHLGNVHLKGRKFASSLEVHKKSFTSISISRHKDKLMKIH